MFDELYGIDDFTFELLDFRDHSTLADLCSNSSGHQSYGKCVFDNISLISCSLHGKTPLPR